MLSSFSIWYINGVSELYRYKNSYDDLSSPGPYRNHNPVKQLNTGSVLNVLNCSQK